MASFNVRGPLFPSISSSVYMSTCTHTCIYRKRRFLETFIQTLNHNTGKKSSATGRFVSVPTSRRKKPLRREWRKGRKNKRRKGLFLLFLFTRVNSAFRRGGSRYHSFHDRVPFIYFSPLMACILYTSRSYACIDSQSFLLDSRSIRFVPLSGTSAFFSILTCGKGRWFQIVYSSPFERVCE